MIIKIIFISLLLMLLQILIKLLPNYNQEELNLGPMIVIIINDKILLLSLIIFLLFLLL